MKVNDHNEMMALLKDSIKSEYDIREECRESDHFLNKKDGQWDPEISNQYREFGRPRYTFDKVNPIISQIMGEIKQNNFALRVSPAGGKSSKDIANIYDGLIRNIRNVSNADVLIANAAEQMIGVGMSALELTHDYIDDDCFDQDLMIKPLFGAHDRVFFDAASKMPDRSDARFIAIAEEIEKTKYDEQFPKGSGASVGLDDGNKVYYYKPDSVTVVRFLFYIDRKIDLVELTDGTVVEDDEKYQKVKDELAAAGITESRRRSRTIGIVHQRYADGKGWLDDAEETVFRHMPVIPMYSNYRLSENKVIYRSLTQRLMDEQRVYNFARSREIEEVALAPRAKYWLTATQAKGYEKRLQRMNISTSPVEFYNADPNAQTPVMQSGAQINAGLSQIAMAMNDDINSTAGMFAANMGDNPNLQSGKAIGKQINQGNNGQMPYHTAVEVCFNQMGKVLVDAIPRVYDSTRQVRIIGDDGKSQNIVINKPVPDMQTQQMVYLNDLNQGKYDVVCDIGASFKARQDEANAAFTEMSKVIPQVAEMGLDIWLNNIQAAGMDKVAERARLIAINNGVIPDDQLTDEEKAMVDQMRSQPPAPDPNMVLAEAEMRKADADMLEQQNKQSMIQLDAQRVQLEGEKTGAEKVKLELDAKKLEIELAKVQSSSQTDMINAETDRIKVLSEVEKKGKEGVKVEADTMKVMQEVQNMSIEQLAAMAYSGNKRMKYNPDTGELS